MPLHLHRIVLPVVLVSFVVGCSSPAQLAQRDEDRCAARGLQPGTDAFAECVTSLGTQRDQRMESRRRDMMERSAVPGSAIRQ